MYIKIGRAYAKREQEVNRATEYFERAIKLYQDAGDPVAVTDTLLGLAFDARGRSPNAAALADMNAYVARAEALWPIDSKGKGDALRKIGERYLDICWRGGVSNSRICEFAVPKAIEYGERAFSLYKQLNDPAGQAVSIANIAEVYVAWGVPPKGFTLASIGGTAGLAKQPWRNRKSRDEAARLLYREALDLFRQAGIKSKEMAETLENLGKLSDDTPPFTEARRYYEEAGSIYIDLNDRRSMRRIAYAIKALDKPTEPKPAPTAPNPSPR
jgi:tetratricopeptide (TPR) repeat protein